MTEEKDTRIIELETGYTFKTKLLLTIIIIGVLFTIFTIILNLKFKVKNVEVTGNIWYTDDEIKNTLQTSFIDNYTVFFKLHYMIRKAPEMPFVDKLSIKVTGTETISIRVYEKNIVGCVYEMGDYLYFDKDGYVISNKAEQANNVPRIEGLDYTSLVIGKKLETSNDKIFNVILSLTQNIDKQKLQVDAIVFDQNFEITIQCTDGNVVYLGKNNRYDEVIQALPNILKAAEEKKTLYWIDMSGFSRDNTTILAKFLNSDGIDPSHSIDPDGEKDDEPETKTE
ncbi:MAG: cell division protein FtsQ/DivIB [Clostridiales bacterium]|nr:cell division protein FtsQ/DivIB [Clostridiales bacterium]